jgi:hypothetical protein
MEHSALPLPDYDHLPLGGLVHRIRSLGEPALAELLEYEQAHADRLPVVQAMQARLAELRDGAQASGGSPVAPAAEAPPAAAAGAPISPATSGPPINPPSHGDPTNPAQPRPTG